MISKIQSSNDNINFKSKVHLDLGAARYLNKYHKLSGDMSFKDQIKQLMHNSNHDIITINLHCDAYTKGIELSVLTEDGCSGKHKFYHAYPSVRDNLDGLRCNLIEMYNKAKSKLEQPLNDNNPFELLNLS